MNGMNINPCELNLYCYDETEYKNLREYWDYSDNIFNSDFDFVVHAEFNGIKDDDIVYYNPDNNAILSEDEYNELYYEIKRNAVCAYKKRTCKDYDKWKEENLPESIFDAHDQCDLLDAFDDALKELGYPDSWTNYGSTGIQEYVYCWINENEWVKSEEYDDFCCPLIYFFKMTFKEAKARLILKMKANGDEDKIYSSPFANANERIANAFEKMANALIENNQLIKEQINQSKVRRRVNKKTGIAHIVRR